MKNKNLFKEGFKYYIGAGVALLLLLTVVFGANAAVVNLTPYRMAGGRLYVVSDYGPIVAGSGVQESYNRMMLICPNGTATTFYVDINTSRGEFQIGEFGLDYRRRTIDLGARGSHEATEALYYLPKEWITKSATEVTQYKELKRNPDKRQIVRGDPTFYRGKDYPDSIPFDEIELTVDAVYRYTDTEETGYNFVFRVKTGEKNLFMNTTSVIVPTNCTLINDAEVPT